MRERNDTFFENALSKNIDADIPISDDLSDTSKKDSTSTMRTSTISNTEKYIYKFHDETVTSELKRRFCWDCDISFPAKKRKQTP